MGRLVGTETPRHSSSRPRQDWTQSGATVIGGSHCDATLAAALREKPAGANLTLTSSTPVTYDDLDTAYTTYSNMTASALTYLELRFS